MSTRKVRYTLFEEHITHCFKKKHEIEPCSYETRLELK